MSADVRLDMITEMIDVGKQCHDASLVTCQYCCSDGRTETDRQTDRLTDIHVRFLLEFVQV